VLSAGAAHLTLPWLPQPVGARVRLQVFARDVTLAAHSPEAVSVQNVLPATVAALRVRADKLALVALETPAGALLASITQQAATRMGLTPGANIFALVKASALGR
jgi:molybdate transport system ATP-binding protein